MRAMVARRSKGWLASLTIPTNSTKKVLNSEVADILQQAAVRAEAEEGGVVPAVSGSLLIGGEPPEPVRGSALAGVRKAEESPARTPGPGLRGTKKRR
eukprot:47849-Rhodomonas_salina.1